jgi:hypothetical protein
LASPSPAKRRLAGWTLHFSPRLLKDDHSGTQRALALLKKQLEAIARVVPAKALTRLRQVPLWLSPPYPGFPPKAEYHPDASWLRQHGRDPEMAKSVEFTNTAILEREISRIPWLVLHELAHAYHDRVLGDDPQIRAAFKRAAASGTYDAVRRRHEDGRAETLERSYAMANEQEYFSKSTEAFFGLSEFYPFDRSDLAAHDPAMERLVRSKWGAGEGGPESSRIGT